MSLRFRLVSDIERLEVQLHRNVKMIFHYSVNPSHFCALLTRLCEQQCTQRQQIFQIISLKATEISGQIVNRDSEKYTKAGSK